LEPHRYQLAHDGHVQFGLISDSGGRINEVFVVPTKHFQVWLDDEAHFRRVMQRHGLDEAERLSFLDEYPRTTLRLADLPDAEDLQSRLKAQLRSP
jgi:hypothetical protein